MRLCRTLVLFLVTIGAAQVAVSTGCAADNDELLRKAEAKYRQGDYEEATAWASRLVEKDSQALDAYRLRAAAYSALGRFEEAIGDLDRCVQLKPALPETYQARGEAHFKAGNIHKSIADFDRFLEKRPDREPHHWQRGISYYYAGEYEQGVRQFELHKRVNPQDVENAVWHYLCKARVDGAEQARALLIEIAGDRRPWAMKVYRMYQGKASPPQVLAHAEQISRTAAERQNNLFYAHLYVGLFHESVNQPDQARRHITIALEKYPSSHYMGDVARVHLQPPQ